MARRKKTKKPKPPSFEEIEALLRQSAKGVEELDKTLKRVFTLTPQQLHTRLD